MMIVTELYPKQQRGYNSLFDDLDIPFLVYYSSSLWFTGIRLRQLRVTWEDRSNSEWLGECSHDDVHKHIHIRLFGCAVKHELLHTLFHELAHAQQFHSGKLRVRNGHWYWVGASVKRKSKRLTLQQYYNLPWELEANALAADICQALVNDQLI